MIWLYVAAFVGALAGLFALLLLLTLALTAWAGSIRRPYASREATRPDFRRWSLGSGREGRRRRRSQGAEHQAIVDLSVAEARQGPTFLWKESQTREED